MWKHNGRTIREFKSWVDDSGITHPKNWHIWSVDEKAAAGLTEVVEETPPDSRLYTWSMGSDGKISKTARALADTGSGDNLVLGVKSNLKKEVKKQQGALLAQTDWAVVRKADKSTAIPSNIQTWRDAIRSKATDMETAITNAADTDAIAAMFLTFDIDGNKSGILYDWPELGD
jgi:phosphotransacetylase